MPEGTTRRVYELPIEMVEAIQRQALARGESEVAAVRRLLEEALARRETGKELAARMGRFDRRSSLGEVLGTLSLHPQVIGITKGTDRAEIRCSDGYIFEVVKAEAATDA